MPARAKHPAPPPPPSSGEQVFLNGSDMAVLGTASERRRQANMARLEGTGKDPLGRYAKGIVFDVPESDPLYEELIDKGWANEVKPEDDPSRTPEQIAQAVVQQHPLTDPVDAKLADKMGVDKAYAVDHTGDPDAKPADVGLKLGKDVAETGTSTPEEVAERSAASQPKQGS